MGTANNNTMWRNTIRKEMKNASIAFGIQESTVPPRGDIKTTYHMIFDVKMDFTRKARIVSDRCKIPDPGIIVHMQVQCHMALSVLHLLMQLLITWISALLI